LSEAIAAQSDLSLYLTEWCSYCVRVRRVIDELGVEIELRDVSEDRDHLQALVGATGRETVPCLRIDDPASDSQWMHESADIIQYLQTRFG